MLLNSVIPQCEYTLLPPHPHALSLHSSYDPLLYYEQMLDFKLESQDSGFAIKCRQSFEFPFIFLLFLMLLVAIRNNSEQTSYNKYAQFASKK